MGHNHSRVNNLTDYEQKPPNPITITPTIPPFPPRPKHRVLQRHDSPVTDVDDDSNSSMRSNVSHENQKISGQNRKYQTQSLTRFPQHITALQYDESIIVACYNVFNDIVYLSDSGYQTMGIDVSIPLDSVSFQASPSRGAIFFRQHTDGSLIQFRNTIKSIQENGEVFTIDERMSNVAKTTLTLLVNPLSSEVTRCDKFNSDWTAANFQVGKKLLNMFSKDNINGVIMALADASKGRSSYSVPATLSNSSNIRYSMDVHPCSDDQVVVLVSLLSSGKCGAAVSDQEQRRCADGELDETTAHLNDEIHFCKDLLDNATLPMLSVSCKGDVLWANTAMVNMMGYSSCPHEFVGSVASKHHVDREQRSEMFNKILQGHPQVDFECKLKHRSGSVIVVNYSSNAKFDSDGKFVHSRCIVRQVNKHSELRSERDEMQKKQLSAEIKEREAVAASKTKSEFLAVMSHELRTPINGVLGATSLLGITSLNDEQRDYVNTITDSADILLSLISNILDISKIENGKIDLENVPLRLVDMVRKCADLMKYRAYERGLTITTEIDSDLNDASVWHRSDPTRLNQVLLNFLSNAVKFTSGGGVQCKLIKLKASGHNGDDDSAGGLLGCDLTGCAMACVDDNSLRNDASSCHFSKSSTSSTSSCNHASYDWLRIEVTDTGCGIADTSMLFAPFVQANKFIHKKYGGTGLGLNISKQIVELMRGRVGITSTEGVGTTVWAEIPMPRASAPRKGPDFVPSSPSDVDLVRRRYVSRPSFGANNEDLTKKVRILIAEDMLVNQKVLKRMLETLGYTDITIANNGQEAVDAIKQSWDDYMVNPKCCSRFDIVLMDCLMPVMDGWSATEAIRSLEADYLIRTETESATYVDTYPTIILALTANATEEDKSRCRECGMDDFYTKPMPRDRLNAMMLRWVSILFADETADKESDNSTQCSIGEL